MLNVNRKKQMKKYRKAFTGQNWPDNDVII